MAAINFEDRRATSYLPGPVQSDPLAQPPRSTVGTQPVGSPQPMPASPTITTQPVPGGTQPGPSNPFAGVLGDPNKGAANLPHGTPPPGWTPQYAPGTSGQSFGNLSDPSTWMGLVGNDANLSGWIKSILPNASPNDVAQWATYIKGKPGANANEQAGSAAYWTDRMLHPENHVEGPSGGAGAFGYDDPSAQIYLQQLLKTLGVVNQPVDPTTMNALTSLATKRATDLQGAPYTDAESAALTTQYRDPLTQARDSAKAQEAQDLSRRGIGPSSGVFASEMNKIDQAYTGGIAKGANTLGVQAVQQKQANADKALSILTNLLGVQNANRSETDSRAQTAASIAQGFPNFDQQRLDSLLRASGGDPTSSALQSILQLANVNNNTNAINNQNDSAYASALAQFIYGLTNGIH